jgi:isopentenyl diphosphate isomerase/L-lactate dehydrogenase-like FMN-dependent dehydrogenase
VLTGRPILWGLAVAVAGERGAARVLQLLRSELEAAMAFCGARSVGQLTRDLVTPTARG